jgi:nucleotide-binding universal stress UspA family protein
MKVLLAVDSSPKSHVIETAMRRPWPSGSLFCVMSVVDLRHWEGLPQLIEDAKAEAASVVKRAADRLAAAGFRLFTETPAGSPKEVIAQYASQWSADLIMVGSHGHSVATRFLLGSVAQAVLRIATCSVEIVRHPAEASRGMRILLATDGSESSAKAVSSIANRPWPAQSEIRILSVAPLLTTDVPSFVSSMRVPVPSVVDEVTKIARTRAEGAVADARKVLSGGALAVSEATPVEEPRAGILDEAKSWGADLIVLGSHGKHGLERLVMGSVSEAVAEYAHCSVEIVR